MKKITLLLLLAFLNVNAQNWEVVGEDELPDGMTIFASIVTGNTGTPYIFTSCCVMKFEDGSWQEIGPDDYTMATTPTDHSFALSDNDTPYVAFRDLANGSKLTVMKFDGNGWVILGTAGFSAEIPSNPSIAIDHNGIPYVCNNQSDSDQLIIRRFTNNSWETLPAITSTQPGYPTIAIDTNNIPYVAYIRYGLKITVQKFENGNWQLVGQEGFANAAYNISLDFDNNNTPYVGFTGFDTLSFFGGMPHKATVLKFINNNWQVAGGDISEFASYTSLALDNNGIPYVTYIDYTNDNKVSVMKLNGEIWEYVGNPGIMEGISEFSDIAIGNNGVPYVSFTTWPTYELTVMKYTTTTGTHTQDLTNITLYPNPADNEVTIANLPATATVTVTDMTGKVLNQLTTQGQTTLNTSGFTNGVYLVEITTANESTVKKLVVNH